MLEQLKQEVYDANMELYHRNIVLFTWGNVSGIDRDMNYIVIKPSGVPYESMKPEDMVVVDFSGNVIEGALKPSSDTMTHIKLYQAFKTIGGITHTHAKFATSFAQAQTSILPLGTTHADHFFGTIPCTRCLTQEEVQAGYEEKTGTVIVETFQELSEIDIPGVLVNGHGPFTWGKSSMESVDHMVILENIAEMSYYTNHLNNNASAIPDYVLRKHYERKHGEHAYYGQINKEVPYARERKK